MSKSCGFKTVIKNLRDADDEDALVNRAGGLSYEIKDPSVRLVTVTGGSFFMEPRYYDDDGIQLVSGFLPSGKRKNLTERARVNKENILKFSSMAHDLDSVTLEIIATAWEIANGENPRDLLAIAHWLRKEINIRSTPVVLYVVASRNPNTQRFVAEYGPKILARPDEVKTAVLVHRWLFGSRSIKNCMCRGMCDALARFNSAALMKYEGTQYPRWKDVLAQLHLRKKNYPVSDSVAAYFMKGIVDGRDEIITHRDILTKRGHEFDDEAREHIEKSRANWEVVLSQFGVGSNDDEKRANSAKVWEYLIDKDLVGYMALLRNIMNMLRCGVNRATIDKVATTLSDPANVIMSKQLPFRFLSAKNMLDMSDHDLMSVNRLNEAVSRAIEIACENNVPELPGLSAIFADNSGSMTSSLSEKSNMTAMEAANVLASMIAKRSGQSVVCAFGTDVAPIHATTSMSVFQIHESICSANTKGCNTNTHKCIQFLRKNNISPDRIIILSDMQCWDSDCSDRSFSGEWKKFRREHKKCWLHSVNLMGYGDAMTPSSEDHVNLVGSFSEKIVNSFLQVEGLEGHAIPTIDQIRQGW